MSIGINNNNIIKSDLPKYQSASKETVIIPLKDNSYKDINNYNFKKPLSVIRSEVVQDRLSLLKPIKDENEYNALLNEILNYKTEPKHNGLPEPIIQRWDYETSDNCLKGLIAYCGDNDKSDLINSWLTGRKLPENVPINDEQIANIIRCMDYSLQKLDDIYGTFKGVVYRKGFFNPITDKQFYSTSTDSIKAVKHSTEYPPAEDNPYSIIKVKNGHDIQAFQLNANSFISRKFAQTEKEILVDRKAKFRLVPEEEYSNADKRIKAVLLTQAIKNTDEINQKDIENTLNEHKDLLKYITVWEEID